MAINLKGAFLSLTNKCNINCRYCYQKSPVNTNRELKTYQWLEIISELKKLGAEKINLTGGEPLIYKDFWKILDYCHKKNFKIKIFTNGLLLNEEKIKKLKEYNLILSFNLNTINEKILRLCKKYKIEFEIAAPLTKENMKNINIFLDKCSNLGAKRVRLIPLILQGNASDLKQERPSENQIKQLKTKIKNYSNITLGCKKCEGGIYFLTIQSDGKVTPCTINKTLIIGDIKKQSLPEILKNAQKSKKNFKRICLH